MVRPTALISLSALLCAFGVAVAAAYYALIPGYETLYICTLVLALIVAVIAYRSTTNPDLRGPAGAIIAACVIYWTLGGSLLPAWANASALLLAPAIIAGALGTLIKQRHAGHANGG